MSQILFIGDSYCHCHGEDALQAWPTVLVNKLQKTYEVFSYPGGSFASQIYAVLNLEQSKIDEVEIVIFCHTHSGRVPSHQYLKIFVDPKNGSPRDLELMDKLEHDYYKYISDMTFINFCEERWFEWLSKKFETKKLVHLHSFDETLSKIDFLKGINIIPSLSTISFNEDDIPLNIDPRMNHMCVENNIILAEQLYEIILKNNSGTFSLDMDKFVKKNV